MAYTLIRIRLNCTRCFERSLPWLLILAFCHVNILVQSTAHGPANTTIRPTFVAIAPALDPPFDILLIGLARV